MNSLKPFLTPAVPPKAMSWASRQALAILAVDGIRPSNSGVALMQAVEAGSITRAKAVQSIIERARLHANH